MRRFAITLVVLVAMSPTMALAADWYRCTMDGQSRPQCCCPAEAEAEQDIPTDAPPDARSACCCDIDVATTPAAQPRMIAEAGAAALGAVVVPRVIVEVQAPTVAIVRPPATAVAQPLSRAPPLFLSNCALLI